MKDLNRPKKEDYDFNDNIEGVRYAKDMNGYADKLEEQLRLYVVSDTLILTPKDAEVFFNEIMNPKDANEALNKAMLKFITC